MNLKLLKNKRSYLASLFKTSAVAVDIVMFFGVILWGVFTWWLGKCIDQFMVESWGSLCFIEGFFAECIIFGIVIVISLIAKYAKFFFHNFIVIERLRKIPLTPEEYKLMQIHSFKEFNQFMYQLFDIKAIATDRTCDHVRDQLEAAYDTAGKYFNYETTSKGYTKMGYCLNEYIYRRSHLCNAVLLSDKYDEETSFVVSIKDALKPNMSSFYTW